MHITRTHTHSRGRKERRNEGNGYCNTQWRQIHGPGNVVAQDGIYRCFEVLQVSEAVSQSHMVIVTLAGSFFINLSAGPIPSLLVG